VAVERDELRHVHALVAHPLDVLDHMQQRRDQPEVAGHWRLERQQRQNALMHLEVAAVDAVVVGDHNPRQLHVVIEHRLKRSVQGGNHEFEPAQRVALELLELFLEVGASGVRHRG
jgi:NADH dehydrogenase/NADH:ubiquinone oxidoreductase subunit G